MSVIAILFSLQVVTHLPESLAAGPAANIDQCANGGVGDPPVVCTGAAWVNGNLNGNQAHYAEGDTVPFRMVFTDLVIGTNTVTLEWDTTKSGKHAYDYLTTFNATETTANPCSGVAGCTTATTFPIPLDPNIPLSGTFTGTQQPGVFKLYNGTITLASAYTLTGSYAGNSSTKITLTFTATSATAVLAWGGHIGSRLDWGLNNSASAIPGSPYHMRLIDLDGGGGNQDRSLASGAVVAPGSITIVKEVDPDNAQSFAFSASGPAGGGLTAQQFTLADDGDEATAPFKAKTFSGLTDFSQPYTFTETEPPLWTLASIVCDDDDSTWSVDTATASVHIDEEENVTCTFTNQKPAPAIEVTKDAATPSVDEPGADVTFNVSVANTAGGEPITLTSLTDDIYGDITQATPTNPDVVSTTCSLGTIAPSTTYTCSFVAHVGGAADTEHVDTVTASGHDADGVEVEDFDDATVTIDDVTPGVTVTKSASPLSLNEPGGTVTYTVTVENTDPAEAVTLTDLVDDKFGDLLDDDGNDLISNSTCVDNSVIAIGDTYSCTFDAEVTGNGGDSHVNTVTGTVVDDEGTEATDDASASVPILDVLPTISVTKSADPTSVDEPGGTVTYTVTVENTDAAEAVTLTDLVDDTFGDLLDDGANAAISNSTCVDNSVIAIGDTYECTFDAEVTGNGGDSHVNTVDAAAVDDDGNTATGSDTATVDINDVLPTIAVTKAASVPSVDEPGGNVTYTVTVENTSIEDLTLTDLVDDRFGDLLDDAGNDAISNSTCVDNSVIAIGTTYECAFDATVTGNGGDSHVNTVTATAADDDGNNVSADASATVEINDLPATISITKTASPTVVRAGDDVTYEYLVSTPGNEPLQDVTVTDDKCSPVTFTDGDTDGDDLLDPGETWRFNCVTTLTADTTNVGTASGFDDDGNPATDTDDAFVDVIAPVIAIDKTVNTPSAAVGDTLVYTYRVTNPGDSPLTDVIVRDDKCAPVVFQSGDTDNDGALDTTETWTYTCTQAATGTTGTNIGTATGTDPTGQQVSATDTATVQIVAGVEFVNQLPRTGGDVGSLAATGAALLGLGIPAWALGGAVRRRRGDDSGDSGGGNPDGGVPIADVTRGRARIRTRLRRRAD